MGLADRSIRIILALVIAGLYFTHVITGLTATILVILAVVFVLTSAIKTCPLYMPFGISTKKKDA
jgi:hypothetical protein